MGAFLRRGAQVSDAFMANARPAKGCASNLCVIRDICRFQAIYAACGFYFYGDACGIIIIGEHLIWTRILFHQTCLKAAQLQF